MLIQEIQSHIYFKREHNLTHLFQVRTYLMGEFWTACLRFGLSGQWAVVHLHLMLPLEFVCFCFCFVLFGLLSVTVLVVIVEICHCTWCYRRNLLGFLCCFDCFLLLHLMLWSDFVCFCFFELLFTCTNFEVLLQKFQLWLRTQIGKL